jgi:co-chaperonin GroES (HSP10)
MPAKQLHFGESARGEDMLVLRESDILGIVE